MPDREQLIEYLRGIQERDGLEAADLESRVRSVQLESMNSGVDAGISEDAFDSWSRLTEGKSLDEQDLFRLEAIVLPNGLRPAFDIIKDSFEQLPSTWQRLNDRRDVVKTIIRGVGRLELDGHPSQPYGGTAFVVGADAILTNRHVAEFFLSGVGDAGHVQFIPGRSAGLDFKQEVGSLESVRLKVLSPIVILDNWDAAVLRTSTLPDGVEPLRLAGASPVGLEGRLAAVIGYPAMDPRSDLVQQIQIFRSTFNKKRLMPGRLTGMRETTSYEQKVVAVAHDCTTLGGNSGSAVIDVETGLAVGLHFGGDYLVANYAVPAWELAKSPAIVAAGVTFA